MEWAITIVVIAMFALAFMFVAKINEKYRIKEKDQKIFKDHWAKIKQHAQSNPKEAIMEADKLLDKALTIKGFKGTLGEKLKKAKIMFKDYNGTWEAHKLRNQLAHEINAKVSEGQAKKALSQFKASLQNLGVEL